MRSPRRPAGRAADDGAAGPRAPRTGQSSAVISPASSSAVGPTTTWTTRPDRTTPKAPEARRASSSTFSWSTTSTRSRVMQGSRSEMFSRPPRPAKIFSEVQIFSHRTVIERPLKAQCGGARGRATTHRLRVQHHFTVGGRASAPVALQQGPRAAVERADMPLRGPAVRERDPPQSCQSSFIQRRKTSGRRRYGAQWTATRDTRLHRCRSTVWSRPTQPQPL